MVISFIRLFERCWRRRRLWPVAWHPQFQRRFGVRSMAWGLNGIILRPVFLFT